MQSLNRKERGSALVETALISFISLLVLSALISFGPYIHISFSVRQAALDCATTAAQTLDQERGLSQGMQAAWITIQTSGLDPDRFHSRLSGNWGRDGKLICTITYQIPLEKIPITSVVPIPAEYSYSVTLPVQVWKSEWKK